MKPVQVILFVAALFGAFFAGRYTGPGMPEESVVVEQLPPVPPEREKAPASAEQSNPLESEEIVFQPPSEPIIASTEEEDEEFDATEPCRAALPEASCWCTCLPEPLPLVHSRIVPEAVSEEIPEGTPEEAAEIVPEPETREEELLADDTQVAEKEKAEPEILPEVLPEAESEVVEENRPPPERPMEAGEKRAEFVSEYDASVCAGDMGIAVRAAVADLEVKSILYGIGPLSDCSGIFHRVLMGVQKRCPGYEYPSLEQYRDSRALARWYHEQGELVLIEDALQHTDLIRPGMVLFFGRSGKVYKNFTVNDLVATRAGIDHLGVVISVATNKSGQLTSYRLFHGYGRKGKTPASTTNWHKRKPTRAKYPPFGNGRQQLVAAARIVRYSP